MHGLNEFRTMGWMRSNIALREGRYVTGVQGTLVDVRAGGAVALIASAALAGVGVGRGRGVVGARGVGLHTTGTPGAAVGEFCCCCHQTVQQVSETWVRVPGTEGDSGATPTAFTFVPLDPNRCN